MPSADDLLEAMRKAGQDFARMADSIEARLPALMSELAEAATTMRPLTAELDKVQPEAVIQRVLEAVPVSREKSRTSPRQRKGSHSPIWWTS